jgi:hypothetical protein
MHEKLKHKKRHKNMNTYKASNCSTISLALGRLFTSSSVHELKSFITGLYSSPSGVSGNGGLVPIIPNTVRYYVHENVFSLHRTQEKRVIGN